MATVVGDYCSFLELLISRQELCSNHQDGILVAVNSNYSCECGLLLRMVHEMVDLVMFEEHLILIAGDSSAGDHWPASSVLHLLQ